MTRPQQTSPETYNNVSTEHTELDELSFLLDGIVEQVQHYPTTPNPFVKIVCFTTNQTRFFKQAVNKFDNLEYTPEMESTNGVYVYKVTLKK